MGTWNASIFGNDTSLDIKEEFFRKIIKSRNCRRQLLFQYRKRSIWQGNEEENFYKEYLRQREIGLEAYQNQVKEECAKISSSEELHFLITECNFDSGNFLSEQMIHHSLCDIETAKWFTGFPQQLIFMKNMVA